MKVVSPELFFARDSRSPAVFLMPETEGRLPIRYVLRTVQMKRRLPEPKKADILPC